MFSFVFAISAVSVSGFQIALAFRRACLAFDILLFRPFFFLQTTRPVRLLGTASGRRDLPSTTARWRRGRSCPGAVLRPSGPTRLGCDR